VKQFGERTGIKVRFGADSVAEELDRARKTVLFRVAQESLNNVAKHAGASNVEVSIQKNGPGIRLAVKDDGKSFEVNEAITGVGSKRLGLIGMQERVRLVNGRLAIESKPRQGTVVRADVPLDPAKQPCEMEPKSVG
jgi:signal transduction histidine kinase